MKQIAWNDEVFISSASVESVRKIYDENEKHIIWWGELYYLYCLRLYETKGFIVDWTLLHPSDYYKFKVKLKQYVPKKELYDYFIWTIDCWCNEEMSATYIPGNISLDDWLEIAKDCCYYTLLSIPEIREIVFMMEQLDMKDELLEFYWLESKTRKLVYNNRSASLTDNQEWTLYLNTVRNEYKQIIIDRAMDFSLFEAWNNLYWDKGDRYAFIGESIATYRTKCMKVLNDIANKYKV